MTGAGKPKATSAQGLGVKFAFALAIALLPLGLVSGLQSNSLLKEASARSEAALLGETLMAAAPEAALIRGARDSSRALAVTMTELRKNTSACSAAMKRLVAESKGSFTFIVFVPLSGLAVCTSKGKPFDLTKSERLVQMREKPQPDVVVIRDGKASGTSVLAFGHPVFDDAGILAGYVSISMPHSMLESRIDPVGNVGAMRNQEPIALITFDEDGNILTSSTGLDDAPMRLPNHLKLTDLATEGARTFAAKSNNNIDRVFAVFPLIDGKIFSLGSWPVSVAIGPLSLWVSPFIMPLLMWIASLLVAMLAAERLVTRHIRTLRKSITSFAAGNRHVEDLYMPDAAVEIRDVTESYLKMTSTILRNEAELEDGIYQRDLLLREVHHRVKNNLQLIASIINMQMRQPHGPEAKTLMKGLQDRVMSLATIHRGLYMTSGLADVRADELLSDILRQMLKMSAGPGRSFDVKSRFDEIRMTPDQAVPLSLLLTEALTNAVKYSGRDGAGVLRLEVILNRDGPKTASLSVTNTIGAETPGASDTGTGLGSQLMVAFGMQLGATTDISIENGIYRLHARFTLRTLAEAEEEDSLSTDPESIIPPLDVV